MNADAIRVELVDPSVTLPLRQQVLRPHQSIEGMAAHTHGGAEVIAVAAFSAPECGDDDVVGTAIVMPAPLPGHPDRPGAWRLRGMTTAAGRRDEGIGTMVLERAIRAVRDRDGLLLWCNARIRAQAFYARAGFTVSGAAWIDPEIGPHVHMWREL